MIPIRCLSCGKPVSAYFDEYNKRVAAGEKSKDVLDESDHSAIISLASNLTLWKYAGTNDLNKNVDRDERSI